ncbi:Gfo/Idh/MocA family oxidoreductase [Sphingomonas sp. PL-96]|uniref:Gfo/Idh/MocA family protein n=1 Tax=Sphingomonas sp. PL-96 TaxID=2887201 RepID=UPI001E4F6B54|nr:Gfo/Idh/MocA family oxidoreductase [Sphingomonas sp. PL-96]MCC2975467.1 Gfo/Idh/MocA family oxidoreductase [Sphingomonas sp. PL-96]
MTRPKLGFLGVGWIGRHRMEAMLATGAVEATAISDPSPEMVAEAQKLAPDAAVVDSLDAMLALGLDGVVIATPSALHAAQSIQALEAGCAVFCQKPLGRSAAEARAVVDAARRADRLLSVDFSYRFTAGMQQIAPLVRDGSLGHVHAIDLTFHNAYGPDKPWFYDPAQSGGGCVMDLGVHLVDLALWTLGFPEVVEVTSHLSSGGQPLTDPDTRVEDFAVATLVLAGGTVVRLACSWRLPAGQDAVIEASFYGTGGAAALRNLNGSFYDFRAERFDGTARHLLADAPDAWGGRAGADWAERLAQSPRFAEDAEELVHSAAVLDRIYGR